MPSRYKFINNSFKLMNMTVAYKATLDSENEKNFRHSCDAVVDFFIISEKVKSFDK